VWLLTNTGHNPLELMILESRPDGDDLDGTPAPPNRRYPYFDRNIWNDSALTDSNSEHNEEDEELDCEEDWLDAEEDEEYPTAHRAGPIVVGDDDVSIETYQDVYSNGYPNITANCGTSTMNF
jgi:hypothetical protein